MCMSILSKITIEVKKILYVLSPVFNCTCFKHCVLVVPVPQNLETEPLRTKVRVLYKSQGLHCSFSVVEGYKLGDLTFRV
jgi:hypothetical protein